MDPDVRIISEGSIFIFDLLTDRARTWVTENVQEGYTTWGRDGLVVEARYAHGIAAVMGDEGLVLA